MRRLLVVVAAVALSFSAQAMETPRRVVSMNACTDQLAMLVAGEGQLLSVSHLAVDPGTSAMSVEARRYPLNHGLAEEIFLMRPDLVLAGTFSTRATVGLLRRLGIRVEEFAPEESMDDIRASILRIGALLGREARAAGIVADMDRRLSTLEAGRRPDLTVAPWFSNSFTTGPGTLVDTALKAAGLTNLATLLGFSGTVRLPLEILIEAAPDILLGEPRGGVPPALAQANTAHPAYRELAGRSATLDVPSSWTVCGTPFIVEAARLMQQRAEGLDPRDRTAATKRAASP